MTIIQNPSPNFSSRNGDTVSMIVVHCTDGYFPYDMEYLQNPAPNSVVGPVSSHFVIAPNGDVHQLVDTANAAWHAGRINNPTVTLKKDASGNFINPNQYSVGIETSMISTDLATPFQYKALTELIASLTAQFNIPLDREHVVGHREIYSLKTCPGTIDINSLLPAQTESQVIAQALPVIQQAVNQLPTTPEPQKSAIKLSLSNLLASFAKYLSTLTSK